MRAAVELFVSRVEFLIGLVYNRERIVAGIFRGVIGRRVWV